MTFDERTLKEKGYTQDERGQWQKPVAPSVGKLEARKHCKQTGALDSSKQAKPSSTRSRRKSSRRKRAPEIIVTMTAHMPRYFDSDNLGIALKPVRDALAEWIGVDDGDYRVQWEHDQTLTRGAQGVCVVVQEA